MQKRRRCRIAAACVSAGQEDVNQGGANLHHLPRGVMDRDDAACVPARDLNGCLVALDLAEGLEGLHFVPDGHGPPEELALLDALARLRKGERDDLAFFRAGLGHGAAGNR